jgi:hypothetical protein
VVNRFLHKPLDLLRAGEIRLHREHLHVRQRTDFALNVSQSI